MARTMQVKRRIGSAGAPATALAGELHYNRTAAAAAGGAAGISNPGPDNLYIGDGTGVHALVSPARQVELWGNQTVAGTKTFDDLAVAVGDLSISGGTGGQLLTTDGAGNLSWMTPEAGGLLSVAVTAPITGNGTSGTPLALTMANSTQVAAGTSDALVLSPLGLASVTGSPTALQTTATTIIPAINELRGQVLALESLITFQGTVSIPSNAVTPAQGAQMTGPTLPAPVVGNTGWMVIATSGGTGVAPAPAVPIAVGDMLISSGAAWVHLPLGLGTVAAGNVTVSAISGLAATDVQAALQEIHTALGEIEVVADQVSIIGDGTAGDPLEVAAVDAGTY